MRDIVLRTLQRLVAGEMRRDDTVYEVELKYCPRETYISVNGNVMTVRDGDNEITLHDIVELADYIKRLGAVYVFSIELYSSGYLVKWFAEGPCRINMYQFASYIDRWGPGMVKYIVSIRPSQ